MLYSKKHVRIYLSLAALFFFAPFVQGLLKKNTLEIDKEDHAFIQGYVRGGFIVIGFTTILIWAYIAEIFTERTLLAYISTRGMYALLGLLMIGVGMVFSHKTILQHGEQVVHWEKTETDASKIIPSFTPIYNIHTRFSLQKFAKPFWWVKEARLRRALYIFIVLIQNNQALNAIILIAIVARTALLIWGIDMIPKNVKNKLNTLFLVNIEEIRCYISGSIRYLAASFKKKTKVNFDNEVESCKEEYMKLHSFKNNRTLIAEYIIGTGLLLRYIKSNMSANIRGVYNLFKYSAIIILVGNYLVHIKWKKFPFIPVIHELVTAANLLGQIIRDKIHSKISLIKKQEKTL